MDEYVGLEDREEGIAEAGHNLYILTVFLKVENYATEKILCITSEKTLANLKGRIGYSGFITLANQGGGYHYFGTRSISRLEYTPLVSQRDKHFYADSIKIAESL